MKSKSVLIVDDENEYRSMVSKYLHKIGCACETAPNASSAMDILSRRHFDLVVSDIRMGSGDDGVSLMIKAKERHPHLDFIIMTGYANQYSYSKIIDAGAADFISKPFQFGELQAKIERIERERETLKELREANAALIWESKVNASFAELSEALIASFPIDEISRLVLKHAGELTESPDGLVGCIDNDTENFVPSILLGEVWEKELVAGKEISTEQFTSLWGWVLKERNSLCTNNPSNDPRSAQTPEGCKLIYRFIAAPAMVGGTLIGLLALANSKRDYTDKDIRMISRLAGIYALSVHRKRAEEELRKARGALEELVRERNAKLTKADQLLRKSLDSMARLYEDHTN